MIKSADIISILKNNDTRAIIDLLAERGKHKPICPITYIKDMKRNPTDKEISTYLSTGKLELIDYQE